MKSSSKMKVAILGAGNGGCATAVDMSLRGIDVVLCSALHPKHLEGIIEKGGLEYSGILGQGFVRIKTTISVKDALEYADVVIITTPSSVHEVYAKLIARHVRKRHVILLNGCTTGGALLVSNIIRGAGIPSPLICETDILRYVCRMMNPTHVRIYHQISNLLFAAFPSKYNDKSYEILQELVPGITVVENVLLTSFSNLNAVIHPAGVVLNSGWIEFTKGDFFFYSQGITEAVAHTIEQIDQERLAVLKRLDLSQVGILEHLRRIGFLHGTTQSFYEAIRASDPVRSIKSPESLDHRFLAEDIGFGLVPLASTARQIHVPVPLIESVIRIGSVINRVDYWRIGLTVDKLGISSFRPEDLRRYLFEGKA